MSSLLRHLNLAAAWATRFATRHSYRYIEEPLSQLGSSGCDLNALRIMHSELRRHVRVKAVYVPPGVAIMPEIWTDRLVQSETSLILAIVKRANEELKFEDLMGLEMSIGCAHIVDTTLDLKKLLEFDELNFAHDVYGISRYLSTTTGRFTNFFLPRCAAPDNGELTPLEALERVDEALGRFIARYEAGQIVSREEMLNDLSQRHNTVKQTLSRFKDLGFGE